MNYFLSFLMGVLSLGIVAQVKIGDNPGTIWTSSLLELESTNKGLIIPRVANSAAITTPVAGMLIYDNSQSCFILYQGGSWSPCLEKKTSTSLTPRYYNAGAFANAENDVAGADLIQLSDNTYLRSGKVTWTGHGLTVGSWYYLDNTAGGYTSTQSNSDLIQKLFFIEDANTIHVDIHQEYGFPYTTSLTTPVIETFTVFSDGQISFVITGPGGGGGSGSNVTAVFNVLKGETITIVNGEGGFGSASNGGGGAGSSGIFIDNTLVAVAGGAGGGGDNTEIGLGASATTTGANGTGTNPGARAAGGAASIEATSAGAGEE